MQVFESTEALIDHLNGYRKIQKDIALVPTMGALHAGHMSLIRAAKASGAMVVCSIFVNPTQFNQVEDFQKYPKTLESDLEMLHNEACDVVWVPSVASMYPVQQILGIDPGPIAHVFEGRFRPGHFSGVCVIVSKLFNVVKPTLAFFGLKDLQQCAVIETLVKQLHFNVSLHWIPTVRESSGLAMSSRNQRLSEREKHEAAQIFKVLSNTKQELLDQKRAVSDIFESGISKLSSIPGAKLDYFSWIELPHFNEISELKPNTRSALIVAIQIGSVRLIDNLLINT